MDKLRSIGIFVVVGFVKSIKWIVYQLLIFLLPVVKSQVLKRFEEWDVIIDGERPWDIQVHNSKFFAKVVAYGSEGLGYSYADGWWDCDELDVMVTKMYDAGAFKSINNPYNNFLTYLQYNLFNMQTRAKAGEVIEQQYDNTDTDFYEATLDQNLNCSCAYWKNADNLDQAHIDKIELVAQKLALKPGMKVLDIGSGFGAIEKYLAEKYGVSVVGYTLHEKAVRAAEKVCSGLDVKFHIKDYREITGSYDRVICIEMLHHVGKSNYKEFFRIVNRSLKDEGLFLLTVVGLHDKNLPDTDSFFSKMWCNVQSPRLEDVISETSGIFILEDIQNVRGDAEMTFMAYHEKFQKNWEAMSVKYGENYCRLWKYSVLLNAGVYRCGGITQLYQYTFSKGGFHGYRSFR